MSSVNKIPKLKSRASLQQTHSGLSKPFLEHEKPHLLIYAHYYIPDIASTGQILKDLAGSINLDNNEFFNPLFFYGCFNCKMAHTLWSQCIIE